MQSLVMVRLLSRWTTIVRVDFCFLCAIPFVNPFKQKKQLLQLHGTKSVCFILPLVLNCRVDERLHQVDRKGEAPVNLLLPLRNKLSPQITCVQPDQGSKRRLVGTIGWFISKLCNLRSHNCWARQHECEVCSFLETSELCFSRSVGLYGFGWCQYL